MSGATGTDWTDAENDAIVADYFAMLAEELAGRDYNKSEHNRNLQALIGRGKGSIEFKHQNISAVLKGLGETWITGYKPAFNYQASLVDAVARWLARNPAWLARSPAGSNLQAAGVAEDAMLWIGPPPTRTNTPPPAELEQMMAVAAKFDVAARDARNRALGRAGEERVLAHERSLLAASGREDLARKVRWVAEEDGDGAGYDIASFEPDGRERLIFAAGFGQSARGNGTLPIHFARNVQPGVTFNGNATGALRPERATNVELGGRLVELPVPGTGLRLSADLSWFETLIRDAVLYFQPGSGGLGGRPITNIFNWDRTIRFRGWDAGVALTLDRLVSTLRFADVDIRDMPPEPQFIARTGAPRGAQWVWDTRAALGDFVAGYALRRTNALTEVPAGQIVYVPKPRFTLHDIQIGWRPAFAPPLSVDVAVTNLTDRRYVAHSTLTQNGLATEEAGRDIRLSLSLRY